MPNEKYKLNNEELKIEKEIENNEWVSSKNIKSIKKESKQIANNTIKKMKKNKSITIRINENVLNKIKAKSLILNIPYQTLITEKLNELIY